MSTKNEVRKIRISQKLSMCLEGRQVLEYFIDQVPIQFPHDSRLRELITLI